MHTIHFDTSLCTVLIVLYGVMFYNANMLSSFLTC